MSPVADRWRQLAETVAGAGPDALLGRTAEGLIVPPLLPRRADDPPQPWRPHAAWAVAQRVDHTRPAAANELARTDLAAGADALVVVDAASPFSRGFGLDLTAGDLDTLFDRIDLDRCGLRLDAGPAVAAGLAALAALVQRRHLASARLPIDLGFDPIGWRARLGRPFAADPAADPVRLLERRAEAGLGGTLFLADGRPYHEAGAGEAQELAAVLATGVAYLRRGEAAGLSLDAARDAVAVLLPADAEVVLGLAKFRAMRRLWSQVEAACRLEPKPLRLHAETSWRMMTRRDPWTNAMRATAATFAAGLAGADTVCVLPMTLPLGLPDAPTRRLARNLQRVLLDEASLARVADPAAGAGAVETLTDDLAARAWAMFQQIEGDGGIERALDAGRLQARIAEVAARRADEIATLRHGLVGTSRYAGLEPPGLTVLDVRPRAQPEPDASALPERRDAAPFEALRDTAEGLTTMLGRPRVFLATLGAPASFGPRATEATNFFAAAGIDADAGRAERSIAELIAAFAAAGTAVACICGADAAYAEAAAPLATALRGAGARLVLLLGGAAEAEPSWREAGIDALIVDGGNALQVLARTLEIAGDVAHTDLA